MHIFDTFIETYIYICMYTDILMYFYINNWLYICLNHFTFFSLIFLPLPNLIANVDSLAYMYNNKNNSDTLCIFKIYNYITYTSLNLPCGLVKWSHF